MSKAQANSMHLELTHDPRHLQTIASCMDAGIHTVPSRGQCPQFMACSLTLIWPSHPGRHTQTCETERQGHPRLTGLKRKSHTAGSPIKPTGLALPFALFFFWSDAESPPKAAQAHLSLCSVPKGLTSEATASAQPLPLFGLPASTSTSISTSSQRQRQSQPTFPSDSTWTLHLVRPITDWFGWLGLIWFIGLVKYASALLWYHDTHTDQTDPFFPNASPALIFTPPPILPNTTASRHQALSHLCFRAGLISGKRVTLYLFTAIVPVFCTTAKQAFITSPPARHLQQTNSNSPRRWKWPATTPTTGNSPVDMSARNDETTEILA